eukprot:TRINITY_DN2419_c0_g1_i2.p1 TRINITY_DN2419_c0_g1~~TRINITY_DN2419_c0_g1_i2.p1  ORF type:complete len:689 (-),score=86.78 TRINITY_DN2419_c0_g1_i2:84-2150(-)
MARASMRLKFLCLVLLLTAPSQVHHAQGLRRNIDSKKNSEDWGWAKDLWNSAKESVNDVHNFVKDKAEDVGDFLYDTGSNLFLNNRSTKVWTLKDIRSTCPQNTDALIDKVFDLMKGATKEQSWLFSNTIGRASKYVFGKPDDVDRVPRGIDDKAELILYHAVVQNLRYYKTRHNSSVRVPMFMTDVDLFKLGDVVAPMHDIDNGRPPMVWKIEIPDMNCIMEVLRGQPMNDDLVDNRIPNRNTWQGKLKENGGTHKDKREFILSYFNRYKQASGEPAWPPLEIDLRQLYYRENAWADDAEKALAFDLLGSHRVERASKAFGGETLTWVVRLNEFATLAVRSGFGKYGADMFFTEDGTPALIVTPDGKEISRGDSSWQYWKFVWRSTLVTGITLVDHLHFAHFRVSNIFARAVRDALPPMHPLRRFMTVFTFGAIDVNVNAMHTLVGPGMSLHRCSPFKDFYQISEVVPDQLRDPIDQHKQFLNATEWERLPQKLKRLPYFQDGRALFGALRRLVFKFEKEFLKVCDGGATADVALTRFHELLFNYTVAGDYKGMQRGESLCSVIRNRLVAAIWSVTGWHRHVGQVIEYKDPDFASPSWKDGEPFGRPKQYFAWAIVAAMTAKIQPKLSEDYTHVFNHMANGERAKSIWREFQMDLKRVKRTVALNNRNRETKNFHADPDIVECSIAV